MLSFLIYLLVLLIVFGLLYWVVSLLPLPEPLGKVALAILALIFVLILLGTLAGVVPLPNWSH